MSDTRVDRIQVLIQEARILADELVGELPRDTRREADWVVIRLEQAQQCATALKEQL